MKYRFIIGIGFGCLVNTNSYAEITCVVHTCNPGYYLGNNSITDVGNGKTYYLSCVRCPGATSTTGATVYGQTNGAGRYKIASCKLPAGKYKDATGTYEILAGGCQY